jgi:enterochelin esterase family protein
MPRVRAAGRVVHLDVQSRVLRGNPLGDPWRRRLPVYLPPGYDDTAPARYPVLYALTGFTGRGAMLLNTTNWGEPLDARLDRLQAEGRIGPMIVVLPDCFTRYGGSQYVNSSAVGDYADHLLHEIVPLVDRTLRTLPLARHRGIFGKSSGGYGAIVHGMMHPEVFGAVACHSGDMAFEYCLFPDFPKLLQQIERHGSAPAFLRAFEAAPRKTNDLIAAINIFAMAACYAPNRRARPLGFDLPFDPRTGAVDAGVWRRWLAHDPLRMLPRRVAALRRLRLLFLDCGRRDEFHLLWGARQMTAALRARGIRHVYEEFDDGHMDISYRYDRSLPHLWEAVRPRARSPRAAGRARRRRNRG